MNKKKESATDSSIPKYPIFQIVITEHFVCVFEVEK